MPPDTLAFISRIAPVGKESGIGTEQGEYSIGKHLGVAQRHFFLGICQSAMKYSYQYLSGIRAIYRLPCRADATKSKSRGGGVRVQTLTTLSICGKMK
jgi:hypothetical protein